MNSGITEPRHVKAVRVTYVVCPLMAAKALLAGYTGSIQSKNTGLYLYKNIFIQPIDVFRKILAATQNPTYCDEKVQTAAAIAGGTGKNCRYCEATRGLAHCSGTKKRIVAILALI